MDLEGVKIKNKRQNIQKSKNLDMVTSPYQNKTKALQTRQKQILQTNQNPSLDPEANQEQISLTNQGQIPLANQEQLPPTNQEQIPLTNQGKIPLTNQEQIPIRLAHQEQIPPAHQEQIPPTNQNQILGPPTNQKQTPVAPVNENLNLIQITAQIEDHRNKIILTTEKHAESMEHQETHQNDYEKQSKQSRAVVPVDGPVDGDGGKGSSRLPVQDEEIFETNAVSCAGEEVLTINDDRQNEQMKKIAKNEAENEGQYGMK
jgi:hypothetical protein